MFSILPPCLFEREIVREGETEYGEVGCFQEQGKRKSVELIDHRHYSMGMKGGGRRGLSREKSE